MATKERWSARLERRLESPLFRFFGVITTAWCGAVAYDALTALALGMAPPVPLGSLWLIAVVVGVLGSYVSVSAHEAGHAVAARRAGVTTKAVRIGIGPVLVRFVVGRTAVQLHAVPVTGRTTHAGSTTLTTRQRMVIVGSGPAMHVVLLLVALPLLLLGPWVAAGATGFIALNLALLGPNLRVRPPTGDGLGNDGWQLQQLRRGGAELLLRHTYQSHAKAVLRGDPGPAIDLLLHQLTTCTGDDDPRMRQLQLHLAHQYARAGRFRDAANVFHELLGRTDADDSSHGLLRACWADAALSDLATSDITADARTLDACRDALAGAGDVRGLTHSRALLALACGDPASAGDLARESLTADEPAAEERHVIAATIALALARLGDTPAARAWLADLPPSTPFAGAAREALSAVPSPRVQPSSR